MRICDVHPSRLLARVWRENGLAAKDIAVARSSSKYFHSLPTEVRLLCAPDFADAGQCHGHFNREPYVDWDSETFPEGNVRSITVVCEWRDQGWGNQKGHFVLQLMRGQSEVVAEAAEHELLGFAPHEGGIASVTLWPDNPVVSMAQQGDHLRVLKVVGGGGGHSLTVRNFTVSLVFESEFTPVSDRHVELEFP